MNTVKLCFFIVAISALSACSTTQVGMNYTKPENSVSLNKPFVAVTNVTDKRGNGVKWLGAVRGGFGNPLKTLETEEPVSEVVQTAFQQGLKSQGILAAKNPKYALQIEMLRFDCNQVVRREAHILLNISLVQKSTGHEVYSKTIRADKVEGSIIALNTGVFASTESLRKLANDVLQDAVNQLTSDPKLRSAL